MELGRLFIYKYLPGALIPEDFENIGFDEFFRLLAMAEVAQEMTIRDMEIAVNHGVAAIFPDTDLE